MASKQTIKRFYIEITNSCNLNCSFCVPTKRKPQFMSLAQFESILQNVKPITNFIYLHVKGEPTIHPNFDQILSLCDSYKMNVQLVTNATHIENITPNHPSLRKISLSCHSLDQHNYDLKELTNKILYLIDHKDQYCRYLECRFWLKDNLQQRATQLYQTLSTSYSLTPCKSHNNYMIKPNVFVGFESSFKWPDISDQPNEYGYCYGGVSMLAILVDGNVTLCCLDNNGDLSIGNIFDQP